jgi:5'(3')-deoxyribonucleotidase
MSRETIAVDVDDVLSMTAPAFIRYSNQKWGTRLRVEDYQEDWPTLWGVERSELAGRVQTMIDDELHTSYEHYLESKEVLEQLRKDYKLVITTSRSKEFHPMTERWIEKNLPGIFEEIHYTGFFDNLRPDGHKATKAELCLQIGADYLIDDQPKHCFAAAEAGITSLLFGDYPWVEVGEIPPGVIRVHDWNQVGEFFYAAS